MSIYHLHAKIISRKDGRRVVAAAAYRAGTVLTDEGSGITHDFRAKRGVVHAEIIAPPTAPGWVYDRQALWNTVEKVEQRRDAQLAREIELALPIELTLQGQIHLARAYVANVLVSVGMIVDIAIHTNDAPNPHAHLLLTTRKITATGFGPKDRSWSTTDSLLGWRRNWAEIANSHLRAARENPQYIDHRSLSQQGIARLPASKWGLSQNA
jgi:ATP-dependent exoDNAse (exonuclease V) alpha subunit